MADAGMTETSRQINALRSEQEAYAAVHGLMQLDHPPTHCSPLTIWSRSARFALSTILSWNGALHSIGFDDIVWPTWCVRPSRSWRQTPPGLARSPPSASFARLDGDASAVQTWSCLPP
jgi:hypothetical protein